VSHLLNKIWVDKADGSRVGYYVVVEGSKKDGKTKYQAIGGGAKLTEAGITFLKEKYGQAIRFREGEESDDARLYLKLPDHILVHSDTEESKREKAEFMQSVLEPFTNTTSGYIDETIERELKEEFSDALGPIDWDLSRVTHVGVVSPLQWEKPGSARSDGAVAYHRIFHMYDLILSEEQFAQLKASPKMRVLTEEDIHAVAEATQRGESMTVLSDGSLLAENVFPTRT
jgi:hypothetical protein